MLLFPCADICFLDDYVDLNATSDSVVLHHHCSSQAALTPQRPCPESAAILFTSRAVSSSTTLHRAAVRLTMSDPSSPVIDTWSDVSHDLGELPAEEYLIVFSPPFFATRVSLAADAAPCVLPGELGCRFPAPSSRASKEPDTETSSERVLSLRRMSPVQFPPSSYQLTQKFQTQAPPPSSSPLNPLQLDFLQSWRTPSQRDLAITPDQTVWLRTCYAPGSDTQHETLISDVDMDTACEDRLLDNASLYSFSGNWIQVLQILPELVICASEAKWKTQQERLRKAKGKVEMMRRLISGDGAGQDVDRSLVEMLERWRSTIPPSSGPDAMVLQVLEVEVQRSCVTHYIIVEDKAALEGEGVLIVWLDPCGRTVRWKRMDAREVEQIAGAWANVSWGDMAEWTDSEVGREYMKEGLGWRTWGIE